MATVKLPKAAGLYDHSTIDPDLRSQINAVLTRDGSIAKIHDKVLHALHANTRDWPTLIQKRCRELLRSGECSTFQQCKDRVMAEIRADREREGKLTNGMGKNGVGGEGRENLAVPVEVMEEAKKITKECLDGAVEVG